MIYEGDKKFTKLAKVGNFDGFWIVNFFFFTSKDFLAWGLIRYSTSLCPYFERYNYFKKYLI